MKIQPCLAENNVSVKKDAHKQYNSPSFRSGSGGAFSIAGTAMQWVQDKGFLASFLIQDFMGMTLPRTGTAYMRDKEVTGKYNFQEGKEVLLREGLTGPIMMAMAPIFLAIATIFGKSTNVNSQLIKRFGNSFKELISKPGFKKELLNNKSALKNEYLEHNIRSILKNTLGEGKFKQEDVKYIMEQLQRYENLPEKLDVKGIFKKKNYRKLCISEIENYINSLKYNSSADLNLLNKLNVGSHGNVRAYRTTDAIEALIKYSDDIIKNNKHLSDMTPEIAENFKNSSIAKRIITTVATIFGTLGAMSYIPKIYAKSDVSPGARTAMLMKEANSEAQKNTELENKNADNVSFKGRRNPNKNWLSKLGEFISKHQNENISSEFEYNGHNFTSTLMALLSVGGLLVPRGFRAYNRAQVDENGKKDKTELYEILIRDLTSSLTVIFAVPMLTRLFVTSYENKSGFVLMEKDRKQSNGKKIWDLINPYSKAHVLTNKEIESLYFGVDTNEKMINFCKYIDKNNGDLQKIFAKSDNVSEVFNENTIKLSDLEKLSKKEKNKKILNLFESMGKKTGEKESWNNSIKKLMQGNEFKTKGNKLLTFAKGLNSMPEAIATVFITPILLGWFISHLTYANTRRIHAKKERETQKNKINSAA